MLAAALGSLTDKLEGSRLVNHAAPQFCHQTNSEGTGHFQKETNLRKKGPW